MNRIFVIYLIIMSSVFSSCERNTAARDAFDDKIALLENDPRLYLSKVDSASYKDVSNVKAATDFLLASLTKNYIDANCYPPKSLLLKSICIFEKNKLRQQQLEALFLLARIYRQEDDLNNEIQTIEQSIEIAYQEDDKEWLFHLYSYLGEMYLRKCNTVKYIKYQTIANQCIKDIPYQELSLLTLVQVAENRVYIDQYEKSYELLLTIENMIGKNSRYYIQTYILQGIALFKMEKWELCIEKLQTVLPQAQTTEQKFICHSILTSCYFHLNDISKAKEHKGLAMSYDEDKKNSPIAIEFYKLCAEFARMNHNGEEETECLREIASRYESVFDSLNGQSLDEAIQAYTRIYEKGIYERKVTIYRYIISGLVFMIILGLMVYINRKKRRAYRIIALQQQIQALEGLKNIQGETKSLILRNFEITKRLAMLKYTQKEQSTKLLKDLGKLNLVHGENLLTTDWDDFYKHIDISFDNFHSLLIRQYPCLNEKEIQLCCLLRAGFKTEEIAAVWTNSVFSVHKYKTHVRKKINAPEGADIIAFLTEELPLQ